MQRVLIAEHFHNTKDKPFVFIDGFPGRGATMTPTELRQIARQLNTIANDAEQGMRGQATYRTQE